jgi:hypothetical protein
VFRARPRALLAALVRAARVPISLPEYDVFLSARRIEVPDSIADRVRRCDDLQALGRLVRRAAGDGDWAPRPRRP